MNAGKPDEKRAGKVEVNTRNGAEASNRLS